MNYRKKPVVIDAMQYDGTVASSQEVTRFMNGVAALRKTREEHGDIRDYDIIVETNRGEAHARPGDWIIRGVKGEFYPCEPDTFAATYEPAGAPTPIGPFGFDEAIRQLKGGKRLARAGWNGKGMHVVMMPGHKNVYASPTTRERHGLVGEPGRESELTVDVAPYLAMMNAQGTIVPGWLASQTDLLADDWTTV